MGKSKVMKRRKLVRNIIFFALICFVFGVFIKQEIDIRGYQKQISELALEIDKQKEIARELEEKEKLYSSNDYIEKIAREELGMVSVDERVFVDENEAD